MDKKELFKCVKNIQRIISQVPMDDHWKALIYKELGKLKEAIHVR